MTARHTTNFLFKNADYFIAQLDDGGIRIGMVGNYCTDIPADHAMFSKVAECGARGDALEVEELSDAIHSIHLQGGDCRVLLTA